MLSPLFATLSYVLLMQPFQKLSRLDCMLLLGSENYFRYFQVLILNGLIQRSSLNAISVTVPPRNSAEFYSHHNYALRDGITHIPLFTKDIFIRPRKMVLIHTMTIKGRSLVAEFEASLIISHICLHYTATKNNKLTIVLFL